MLFNGVKYPELAGIDLNHLRALHALLEEASVTRAAQRLGITPPAASNALRRLRDLLGDSLLVRVGQGMVRTPKGEALRGPASTFMAAAQALVFPGGFDAKQWQGVFPLLISDYVYATIATPLERLLAEHLPGAKVRVHMPGAIDPEHWLAEREGLVIDPYGERPTRGFAELLYEERMVLVMRDTDCLPNEVSLDTFCDLRHLLVSPGGRPGSIIDRRLQALGRSRDVVHEVPTFFLAAHILAHSDLVSALPERFAKLVAPHFGLVVRALPLETPTIRFWVSGHRRHVDSPLHQLMGSLIRRAS